MFMQDLAFTKPVVIVLNCGFISFYPILNHCFSPAWLATVEDGHRLTLNVCVAHVSRVDVCMGQSFARWFSGAGVGRDSGSRRLWEIAQEVCRVHSRDANRRGNDQVRALVKSFQWCWNGGRDLLPQLGQLAKQCLV